MTNHCVYAKDTLLAKNMNLSPDNIQQDICFPKNYKDSNLQGKPKGLRKDLSKRGLWRDKMKL
ncbi:29746_t:CDS:2, partial [Gigaspora margarita]